MRKTEHKYVGTKNPHSCYGQAVTTVFSLVAKTNRKMYSYFILNIHKKYKYTFQFLKKKGKTSPAFVCEINFSF